MVDVIITSVPSPGDGGGLKHLGDWTLTPVLDDWAGRRHSKQRWTTPDGKNRPPARIDLYEDHSGGKSKTWYWVYRASNYLGAVDTFAKAKDLAQRNVRLADAIEGLSRNGVMSPDDLPAFLKLTMEERRFQRDWTQARRYDEAGKLIPKTGPEFMKKYQGMSVETLSLEYNKLVETARTMGLDSFRPITRFPNESAALEKILAIESSIRARQQSEKAVKQEPKTKGPIPREVPPPATKAASPKAQQKEEAYMATEAKKAAKKTAKKAPAKKGAKKVAKKAAAAPKGPKVYERPAGKKGEFTAKLNTRPGTNRDKLALFLFDNLGKMIEVAKVTKAVYGSADAPGLTNVVNGLKNDIEAAKASYHVKREDGAIGLFTGNGK